MSNMDQFGIKMGLLVCVFAAVLHSSRADINEEWARNETSLMDPYKTDDVRRRSLLLSLIQQSLLSAQLAVLSRALFTLKLNFFRRFIQKVLQINSKFVFPSFDKLLRVPGLMTRKLLQRLIDSQHKIIDQFVLRNARKLKATKGLKKTSKKLIKKLIKKMIKKRIFRKIAFKIMRKMLKKVKKRILKRFVKKVFRIFKSIVASKLTAIDKMIKKVLTRKIMKHIIKKVVRKTAKKILRKILKNKFKAKRIMKKLFKKMIKKSIRKKIKRKIKKIITKPLRKITKKLLKKMLKKAAPGLIVLGIVGLVLGLSLGLGLGIPRGAGDDGDADGDGIDDDGQRRILQEILPLFEPATLSRLSDYRQKRDVTCRQRRTCEAGQKRLFLDNNPVTLFYPRIKDKDFCSRSYPTCP